MSAPSLKRGEPSGRKTRWMVGSVVFLTVVALGWNPVYAHLRALAVLLRIQSSEAHGFFADVGIHPIRTQDSDFASGARRLPTRLYVPTDLDHVPAMVIVHGIHHLGYNEPRLIRFAKAMAGAGVVVSTPELPELAGYEVKPISIDEIAAAADDLAQRLHTPCVGVLGLSFAGGLALQVASDPETARHICFVVAVGAHDDMARVMKFFATDQAEYPDGTVRPMVSHEYGVLVAIYAHPEDYFPAADVAAARDAIRAQLFEQVPRAEEIAARMTPTGRAIMQMLLSSDHSTIKKMLLEKFDKHREEMEAVSPAAQIYRIHVPVMLLHGAGDNVIPPSETLWLAKDLPPQDVRAVLVSPAISHVEVGKEATFADKWRLVDFIADMLAEARTAPYNSVELTRFGGAATLLH